MRELDCNLCVICTAFGAIFVLFYIHTLQNATSTFN